MLSPQSNNHVPKFLDWLLSTSNRWGWPFFPLEIFFCLVLDVVDELEANEWRRNAVQETPRVMLGVHEAVPTKIRSMSPERAGLNVFLAGASSVSSPLSFTSESGMACKFPACNMGWYRCRMSSSPYRVLLPSRRYWRVGYCLLTRSNRSIMGDCF